MAVFADDPDRQTDGLSPDEQTTLDMWITFAQTGEAGLDDAIMAVHGALCYF